MALRIQIEEIFRRNTHDKLIAAITDLFKKSGKSVLLDDNAKEQKKKSHHHKFSSFVKALCLGTS